MTPLRRRLEAIRRKVGIEWQALEKDYLLSWILAGIQSVPSLRETLIFKGGTALKKCYFGDYRYSEDLDFSIVSGWKTRSLESEFREACEVAEQLLRRHEPIRLVPEVYRENEPHPLGQQAFLVRARFPWHRELHTVIKVEITPMEDLIWPPVERPILHEYGESFAFDARVYALEEIVAEKLRAKLQFAKKVHERGWSRSRARDYYDLWSIFGGYRGQLRLDDLRGAVERKCQGKDVSFTSYQDFFQPEVMKRVTETWDQWLGDLVPDLPKCDTVMDSLLLQIEELIGR